MSSTMLSCPGCGNETELTEVRRDADAFCRLCDYPLFWAPVAVQLATRTAGAGVGLRRLPGTAGHAAEASLPCPTCREPNAFQASVCIRCGADLRPVVFEAPPPPPPAPEPASEPERRSPWWYVAAALVLLAVLAVLVLLVFR
ncbi:MAG: hypothetical protein JWM47_1943 [Acidimicrobiales bacterium]|nr:hypothetical protein [Acidimicrobiales bacterium]